MENTGDNIFILIIIATLGIFIISLGVFYFFIAYIRKTARTRAELQKQEMEHQAQLFSTIVTSQEEERRLIGKELHDEVSSVLYAIRLRLKTNLTEENAANLEAVDKIINITRNISHLLSPPEIEILGFHDSIRELCSNFPVNNSGIQIYLNDTADGFIPKEKFQVSLMLYRVIQELITNTIKHAQATAVYINVWNKDDEFHIEYIDNGTGIDQSKNNKPSLGFKNIISRLLLIKATYDYGSDNGFKFNIRLNHQYILNNG